MIPAGGPLASHKRHVEEQETAQQNGVSACSETDNEPEDITLWQQQKTQPVPCTGRRHSQKKRPRLQYREHEDSFPSDDDDDNDDDVSFQTDETAEGSGQQQQQQQQHQAAGIANDTSANAAAASGGLEVARGLRHTESGHWLLRRNRSNLSVCSTRTEASDDVEEAATTPTHANTGSPFTTSPGSGASTPIISTNNRPVSLIMVRDRDCNSDSSVLHTHNELQGQLDNLTSRVENWSLTNLRALRRNNSFPDQNSSSSTTATSRARQEQVRTAKRNVMRVLRRSSTSMSSSSVMEN